MAGRRVYREVSELRFCDPPTLEDKEMCTRAAKLIESLAADVSILRGALIDEWKRGDWGEQAIDEKLMELGFQPEPDHEGQ